MSMQMEKPVAKKMVVRDVEAGVQVAEVALDPRELDRQFVMRQRAHRHSVNGGYGMEYSPLALSNKDTDYALREGQDIMDSCQKSPDHDTNSTATTVQLEAVDSDDDDDDYNQVIGSLDVPMKKVMGTCERHFLAKDKSQQHLIAMAQGLYARKTDIMYPGLMFDLELDERLKSFHHKSSVLPKLHHLAEEAARRATLFKIKPMRKAVRRNELIHWLKLHAIVDPMDQTFLADEVNQTYKAIKLQLDEASAADRLAMGNRNWVSSNWLRLYCCAIDDAVRPFMLTKDDCIINRTAVQPYPIGCTPVAIAHRQMVGCRSFI